MADLHNAGRLSATTDTAKASSEADVIVVIVPAHLTADRDIDFSILQAASAEVGKGLRRGALVIYETTVNVGGTRRTLIPVLEKHSGLKAGEDFEVGYSPERVKANLVLARLETTLKVVGGLDAAIRSARSAAFYGQYLGAPVEDVGSIEAAEMTKLLGMLYRDVNIALANELAGFCEVAGVDFERVRAAANSDGEANVLLAGIGVGGHCTPVYPYFLTRESRRLGLPQRISEAAREINDHQPARQLERVAALWKPLKGHKVHLLGLGFRPGVKVDTFSPAYALRDELRLARCAGHAGRPVLCRRRDTKGGLRSGQRRRREGHRSEHRPCGVCATGFRCVAQGRRGGRPGRAQFLESTRGRGQRHPLLRHRPLGPLRDALTSGAGTSRPDLRPAIRAPIERAQWRYRI